MKSRLMSRRSTVVILLVAGIAAVMGGALWLTRSVVTGGDQRETTDMTATSVSGDARAPKPGGPNVEPAKGLEGLAALLEEADRLYEAAIRGPGNGPAEAAVNGR